MNLEQDGQEVLKIIKEDDFFPFKSGNLKFHATKGEMIDQYTYCITFDTKIAPYIPFLEEGTQPHDIPHAFGFGTIYPDKPNPYTHEIPFGIGGRFDGKFHPGSEKHKGFIRVWAVPSVVEYFLKKYEGELK